MARLLFSIFGWRRSFIFAPGLVLTGFFLALLSVQAAPVPTARRPVVTDYHGVKVSDDYQWLEGADAPVREWSNQQNAQARVYLDALALRPLIKARLNELLLATPNRDASFAWVAGRLFFLRFRPPAQQSVLVTREGTNAVTVVLDPNTLSQDGAVAIDWFVPSPDGKLVAVSVSTGGSESGTLRFYETLTGRKLGDEIPWVNGPTAGGSACWNADGRGVFYTRYPRPGERAAGEEGFYQQVYYHRLGESPERDRYEIGKEFPRIAEIELKASPAHDWILATVANGDGGQYAHWLRNPRGEWSQVTRFEDGASQAEFGRDPLFVEWGRDSALYLLTHQAANRARILRLPLADPILSRAQVIVPEGTNALLRFAPSASGFYLAYINGGPMELRYLDLVAGTNRLVLPRRVPNSEANEGSDLVAIRELLVTRGDELVFESASYLEPAKWQFHDPNDDARGVSNLFPAVASLELTDIEAIRQYAPSQDGTLIPMTILRRRGISRDGAAPTLLTGYGGYGISNLPYFDPSRRVWLEQGGIIAIANLRGGGEFGEEWHKAGQLLNKQNVFDDFAACAQFLVRSNYTAPGQLAIEGGSNGGLLMGAMLTQHPDLFRAVVSHVGIYDMLRVELDPNGAFNVTEFGTVKDPAQFKALHAYSPYHEVTAGKEFPAALFLTGENDGRVNPAHSRKMVARLQAAQTGPQPILLRTSGSTGHGQGTPFSARVEQLSDVYAFLCEQLGFFYSVIQSGPWSGAVTPTSAVVKAKLAESGMQARLVWAEDANLTNPRYVVTAPSSPEHGDVVKFTLDHLKPNQVYHYAVEVDGRLERTKGGQFQTFPTGPASFTLAFASCARTGSASDVFDRIRENHPLFYMSMGDFHYQNISTNLRSRFRNAYDSVLASPSQARLYRDVPFVYIWDDHDFGGNGSGRRSTSHEAARLTYQEYVPHYPLGSGGGDLPIYQSFQVGRVKFILTDLRSERDSTAAPDDAKKSMMGRAQKEWFKKELLAANNRFPLICWVSSVPWLGERGTNYYRGIATNQTGFIHHTNLVNVQTNQAATTARAGITSRLGTGRPRAAGAGDEDHWSAYSTERREIADFIKSNHIHGVCILHGDAHSLGADDGSHSDFATGGGVPIPVMAAAPLDQNSSIKGGPYSQGVYKPTRTEGCFGLLKITDKGDMIEVNYSGRNNRNEEKISLNFHVPAVPVRSTARH